MDIFSELKNLNNAWVIVSRHNGNVFFKRRRYVTKLKNYPDTECLFYSENEAKEELTRLNSDRKKCKYAIENASKYFVNSFEYRGWHGSKITNKAIPIKLVQEKRTEIKSTSNIKDTMIKDIRDNIKRCQDRIVNENAQIVQYESKFNEIFAMDIEGMLQAYETQGDRIVKVLFSAKEKV